MLAAGKGNSKIGELVIEMGAYLNNKTTSGVSALPHATLCGNASFVELLLAKGVSLDGGPHGTSVDVNLDWLAKFYPDRMRRIRKAYDAERESRALRSLT
jgi:ankyrin repeat protein